MNIFNAPSNKNMTHLGESNGVTTENCVENQNSNQFEWPSAKGIYELIKCTSVLKNLSVIDLKGLSLKVLIMANAPLLTMSSFDARLYERFLKKLVASNPECKMTAAELVVEQTEEFVRLTTTTNTNQNCLSHVNKIVFLFMLI